MKYFLVLLVLSLTSCCTLDEKRLNLEYEVGYCVASSMILVGMPNNIANHACRCMHDELANGLIKGRVDIIAKMCLDKAIERFGLPKPQMYKSL